MAFADPVTLTVATLGKTLNRVGPQNGSSQYKSTDGAWSKKVSHSRGKRLRSVMRFDQTKTAADPLITGTNRIYGQSVQIILDTELSGFSTQEKIDLLIAAADYLKAGTNSTKFVGEEV